MSETTKENEVKAKSSEGDKHEKEGALQIPKEYVDAVYADCELCLDKFPGGEGCAMADRLKVLEIAELRRSNNIRAMQLEFDMQKAQESQNKVDGLLSSFKDQMVEKVRKQKEALEQQQKQSEQQEQPKNNGMQDGHGFKEK